MYSFQVWGNRRGSKWDLCQGWKMLACRHQNLRLLDGYKDRCSRATDASSHCNTPSISCLPTSILQRLVARHPAPEHINISLLYHLCTIGWSWASTDHFQCSKESLIAYKQAPNQWSYQWFSAVLPSGPLLWTSTLLSFDHIKSCNVRRCSHLSLSRASQCAWSRWKMSGYSGRIYSIRLSFQS